MLLVKVRFKPTIDIGGATYRLSISRNHWIPFQPSTSGDWEWRAEPVDPEGSPGLHPHPINGVFYPSPRPRHETCRQVSAPRIGRLFSGGASGLDAFSPYPRRRSCPACPTGQLVHQRPPRPVPFVLRTCSPQAAGTSSR